MKINSSKRNKKIVLLFEQIKLSRMPFLIRYCPLLIQQLETAEVIF